MDAVAQLALDIVQLLQFHVLILLGEGQIVDEIDLGVEFQFQGAFRRLDALDGNVQLDDFLFAGGHLLLQFRDGALRGHQFAVQGHVSLFGFGQRLFGFGRQEVFLVDETVDVGFERNVLGLERGLRRGQDADLGVEGEPFVVEPVELLDLVRFQSGVVLQQLLDLRLRGADLALQFLHLRPVLGVAARSLLAKVLLPLQVGLDPLQLLFVLADLVFQHESVRLGGPVFVFELDRCLASFFEIALHREYKTKNKSTIEISLPSNSICVVRLTEIFSS